MDPAIDFAALFKEFDTAVMGRKTYEVMTAQGGTGAMPGIDVVVFSRTLPPATHPGVRIVSEDPREVVAALKAKPGRDIWLYGRGASCFGRCSTPASSTRWSRPSFPSSSARASRSSRPGPRRSSCWPTRKPSRPAGSLRSPTRFRGVLALLPALGTSRPRSPGRRSVRALAKRPSHETVGVV